MTPNEYQQLANRTEPNSIDYFNATSRIDGATDGDYKPIRLLHASMGLCTEAGELMDALKRAVFYGKTLDQTNVVEECGDLLWYIAIIANVTGISIEEMMRRNIAKLQVRFPQAFSESAAQVRDLVAERASLERDIPAERVSVE